ncbi:MAG: glycosyltransferase, partial [Candidatus Micrarchaeota archaeon]|nr:glycosyltransferase [Candidatus Micrarchaeota archaeon]
MRIAIVNITKPVHGTGDGMTEYTYQLIKNLRMEKGVYVDSFYALDETRRVNTIGLVSAQSGLGRITLKILDGKYDVVHITNQEAGAVARILKQNGCKAKILTTVHDTMRLRSDLHRGFKQRIYNYIVKRHILNAIDYSDKLIFDEPKTVKELQAFRGFSRYRVILLGVDERFMAKKARKAKSKEFVVG